MFVLQKYIFIRRKLAQTLAQAKNKKWGYFLIKLRAKKWLAIFGQNVMLFSQGSRIAALWFYPQ